MGNLASLIIHLEEHPETSFGKEKVFGPYRYSRVHPENTVVVNKWSLHSDGKTNGKGYDILTAEHTDPSGRTFTFVNFRKPGTHWLSERQKIYKVSEDY